MCPGGTQQESRRVERSEKREGFSMQHDASPESPAQPVHRSSATKRKLFCCCRCFPYNYRSCSDAIVTDDTQRDWRSSIQHACLQNPPWCLNIPEHLQSQTHKARRIPEEPGPSRSTPTHTVSCRYHTE
ncbi:uncharacterized protein AB9W97_013873 isoform 3-T3 [Spinachia spinachia]